jgi:NADH-quinone oxidoreductase subunit D
MTLFMYAWKDREIVMDILEMLTGNRINYGMNTLGGTRRDVTPEQAEKVLEAVDALELRTQYYVQTVMHETTVLQRFSGVGRLSKEDSLRLGTVGPVLRATGVPRDVRRDDDVSGVYSELDFQVITDIHADVYGRAVVRILELLESYKIIRQILKKLPEGPISVRCPDKIPAGEAVSRYEAPRGEDVHYTRSNGTNMPARVKVRAPTLANLASITYMIEGGYLADVPVIIAAIDPCFSCTDRMVRVTNASSGEQQMFDWDGLRRYSIDWYKKHGIALN